MKQLETIKHSSYFYRKTSNLYLRLLNTMAAERKRKLKLN